MSHISLIPFVCGAGATTAGSELGSMYCYDHGLDNVLKKSGLAVSWHTNPHDTWQLPEGAAAHQDLKPRGHPDRFKTVSWHIAKLAEAVQATLSAGNIAVTIGGDHSMAAGSMAGAQLALGAQHRLGLVWIDAHADLHTYATSISKAYHGMPVGTLTGLDATLALPNVKYPLFLPQDILYAGQRDVEDAEYTHAQQLGIKFHEMADLRAGNMQATLSAALNRLVAECDYILLSVDLDAFCPELSPAVGTPVAKGFTKEEILPLLRDLYRTGKVPLIDVVEFNPSLSGAETTYHLLCDVLREILAPQ